MFLRTSLSGDCSIPEMFLSSVIVSICVKECSSMFSFSSGATTENFTVTKDLFLLNPLITRWRFEVIYSFSSPLLSSSSLDFLINSPPRNGSCSISPSNGSALTLFTVSCLDWFDEDGIQDYSLFLCSLECSSRLLIGYSSDSVFDVLLPARVESLHFSISIRDREDCVSQWTNLSSISVQMDSNVFDDFLNILLNTGGSTTTTTNSFLRLLTMGNGNEVSEVITSLSVHLNQLSVENVHTAISSRSLLLLSFSVQSLISRGNCRVDDFHLSVGFLILSFVSVESFFSL